MIMKSQVKISLLLYIILFFLCSCTNTQSISSERYCFGTLCKVTLYGKVKNSDDVFDGLWKKMTDLENRISCKRENSTVTRMNKGEKTQFDEDIEALIETGETFMELTGNRFNIYIGKVSELWAIGTEDARLPSQEEIETALMVKSIDLGALGKGYASDVAKEYLLENGVKSALINFGGNICCVGKKGNEDFTIGIQDPSGQRGTYLQTVKVHDMCVVTSGSYERYFEQDGVRYSHILDGKTGYPVQTELGSVTVIGPCGLICDALSTACYILGEEESSILLEKFEDYSVLFL